MEQNMSHNDRVALSLFMMRAAIFVVMLVWTLDKFINPGHAVSIFETFYGIEHNVAVQIMPMAAFGELILIIAFVAGIKKHLTYGLVLLLNTIATLSAWHMYMSPFADPNMLHWASWPMLAACYGLYMMRGLDTKFSMCGGKKSCCPVMKTAKTDSKPAAVAASASTPAKAPAPAATAGAPAKKVAAKKVAAKKVAAKKSAKKAVKKAGKKTAKKAAAKSGTKSAAQKTSVKKAPVKKATAKKSPAKKAAPKKETVKKTVKKAAKKPAKKAASKKAAKKTAKKTAKK